MDARTAAAFIPSSAPTSMLAAAAFQAAARPTRVMRDTSFVQGGFTYTASGDFANAGGLPIPYGPDAVALIWQTRSVVGTQVSPRDSVTLDFNDYDSVIEITGVQVGRDTLNFAGGSDDTLLHSFRSLDNSQTRYYHWGSAVTFQNIKIRKSALQAGGIVTPLSGAIVFGINADRLNSRNRQDIVENDLQAIVRINFNGSTIVDLIVDSTYLFRWNMATGQIVRAN